MSPNLRGAVWIVASAFMSTLMAMLVKYLAPDYPAALQALYRQATGLIVLSPLIVRNPYRVLNAKHPGVLVWLALASTAGTILSFYSFQAMPLADASALSFTRILWFVPLAVWILREHVGSTRVMATIVGFLGVLLMVQPSGSGHQTLPLAAALGSALIIAFAVIVTKIAVRDHSTATTMAWLSILGFLFAIPPALFVWRWPTMVDIVLLALMGLLATASQACYLRGMSLGDAVILAPLDYTRLMFAVALDYALFGDIPNALTMTGAGIVIVSTLYITIRDIRLRVSQPLPTDGPG